MSKKPLMLMILDGWGIAPASEVNAAHLAHTPNLDRYFAEFPHTTLEASGLEVGLPEGQIGNSEVGHLNIGAGRIIYQSLTRITKAIKDGDFFANKVLCDCMDKTKEAGKALHLMGLLSDGGVHSNINHLIALLEMAKARGLEKVYVHAFLDGRDVPPKSAVGFIKQLQEVMAATSFGKIATVIGRYYAMDRDKRWDRVEKAYRALVLGEGKIVAEPVEGVEASYAAGV
ncbi:MAG: 2,3-bisphosphoglycerate-independent phosphoglycerate mutase, partial [Acidaminococcaceae bacterium]|nr:2,3-bisphosphoglycerate-independent phosphoglycerate mutase [Acidaminococcaceae bacterium]